MVKVENIESAVLKDLQEDIPITKSPFSDLSRKLGIDVNSLIPVIKDLKDRKIIRQVSPIYDTRKLGYESLLVAFKVNPSDIEWAAGIINTHPGVSHNYERNHGFNLWFTLAIPPDSRLGPDKTVEILAQKTGTKEYAILRAKRVFKIGLRLDMDCSGLEAKTDFSSKNLHDEKIILTEKEKEIIRVTQEDMPLVERPFSVFASELHMEEEEVIMKLRHFRKEGIMRRFAAVLYHRNAGFVANGMVVWNVPGDMIEEAGRRIASYKAVSHCYERTTDSLWQYNLFSMLHARTKEELEDTVRIISSDIKIKDFAILYSTREFKKKRVKYFKEDIYLWEENQV